MSWQRITFAVASPGGVDPSAMNKVVRRASAWGAELELFHCVFDS